MKLKIRSAVAALALVAGLGVATVPMAQSASAASKTPKSVFFCNTATDYSVKVYVYTDPADSTFTMKSGSGCVQKYLAPYSTSFVFQLTSTKGEQKLAPASIQLGESCSYWESFQFSKTYKTFESGGYKHLC
ncbi:hypothetical protein [Kineosporia succinea]|uniref:Uncharacterized protein n=1 Tax=Kineosporia succinea TaxID=84632 RepID=A0ABT9PE60_9ACTN|nr:hypothetical protein [Kineosporia succinea]MDP9830996.1 hypothetical protein [Kineosporia succinea]